MKKAPKIESETIKNGVGNWMLFFVGLEGWKMEAWGELGLRECGSERGLARSSNGFWCSGGRIIGGGKSL